MLGRGSFSHALGNLSAAHAVAKNAVAFRTVSKLGAGKPVTPRPLVKHVAVHDMGAFIGLCVSPGLGENDDRCGRASKAPINLKTGQPIG
jgi:hypothetical protein